MRLFGLYIYNKNWKLRHDLLAVDYDDLYDEAEDVSNVNLDLNERLVETMKTNQGLIEERNALEQRLADLGVEEFVQKVAERKGIEDAAKAISGDADLSRPLRDTLLEEAITKAGNIRTIAAAAMAREAQNTAPRSGMFSNTYIMPVANATPGTWYTETRVVEPAREDSTLSTMIGFIAGMAMAQSEPAKAETSVSHESSSSHDTYTPSSSSTDSYTSSSSSSDSYSSSSSDFSSSSSDFSSSSSDFSSGGSF